MTVRAAQVLAFPGIDVETLAKLRARACDAFIRNDFSTYQEACMMMRRLIGGEDVSETDSRSCGYSEGDRRRRPLSQETREIGAWFDVAMPAVSKSESIQTTSDGR
jgi:hypothetical protein